MHSLPVKVRPGYNGCRHCQAMSGPVCLSLPLPPTLVFRPKSFGGSAENGAKKNVERGMHQDRYFC